ncbi:MAG: fluoride efflux transporter CrcB [Bacteroidota bacterium]|jgi:CrcB protein
MWRNFLFVASGGALGSMLRYATGLVINNKTFPLATLMVNIIGSFIIGVVLAMSEKSAAFESQWKVLLASGICGGFTTFSSFSAENMQLIQQQKIALFAVYAGISIVLGILAAWLGYKLISN